MGPGSRDPEDDHWSRRHPCCPSWLGVGGVGRPRKGYGTTPWIECFWTSAVWGVVLATGICTGSQPSLPATTRSHLTPLHRTPCHLTPRHLTSCHLVPPPPGAPPPDTPPPDAPPPGPTPQDSPASSGLETGSRQDDYMEVGGDHLPMRGSGELRMGKGACHLGKEDPKAAVTRGPFVEPLGDLFCFWGPVKAGGPILGQ